ncbi:MAG TPA: hypothetical protein VK689_10865, partial [Armatimonadota bacterium]|nr:hypothetical protein [Armatimonadota bacterium]
PPSDGAALTHYLGGVNFEESGVTRFAVAAYLATLQTGSDLIPIEELRSRLARLRSEQPAEYEEGLKTAASGGLPISAVEKELREAPETRSRPRALR